MRARTTSLTRRHAGSCEAAPAEVTGAALQAHLAKELKSNKAERDQLVAILALCGVLDSPQLPGFAERFVPVPERTLPSRRFVDMAYPACWWSGDRGVNRVRLEELFGHAL